MFKLVMRRIFVFWCWLIAADVVFQVLLAGLFIFGVSSKDAHVANGYLLFLATLLGGIFALLARVPGRVIGASWALFGLVVVQISLVDSGIPVLRALHPVNALAIFAVAGLLAVRSRAYFAASAAPAATSKRAA
jgi:hypothetical protein